MNEDFTISEKDFRRMKARENAALYCLGWMDSARVTDRTKADLLRTVNEVRGRLERAFAPGREKEEVAS